MVPSPPSALIHAVVIIDLVAAVVLVVVVVHVIVLCLLLFLLCLLLLLSLLSRRLLRALFFGSFETSAGRRSGCRFVSPSSNLLPHTVIIEGLAYCFSLLLSVMVLPAVGLLTVGKLAFMLSAVGFVVLSSLQDIFNHILRSIIGPAGDLTAPYTIR